MAKVDLLSDALRPPGGWLRSWRIEREMSLQAVADRLDVSPQAVHQFEKSEVAGTISLRQLALVARAMGCRVSYRVEAAESAEREAARVADCAARPAVPVPVAESAASHAPAPTESIARSLFLDNQESGRFD